MTLSALRGQRIELPGPVIVIDDCYNANPMSMRAALDDLSASASGRRVAVLGDMLELGPDEVRFHEEVGAPRRAGAASTVLIAVGPLAAHMARDGYGGELHAVGDAAAAARSPGELVRPGGHRARQGLARRRPRGSSPRACAQRARRRTDLMGEVLIAGTAALLICIFLSPKFIAFFHDREFGQFIREDGPAAHHVKAGTPTMGGVIIFTAISIPFLMLSDYDWRSVGVFGAAVCCALLGFADDYIKIVRRRSLGISGRMKLGVTGPDLDRPVVGRDAEGGPAADAAPARRSTTRSTSASSPGSRT